MDEDNEDEGGFTPEAFAAIQGISLEEAKAQLGEPRGPGLTPPKGHNSEASENLTKAARDKLKSVIAQIEKLEEEKKEVAEQIRDVYSSAKSMGYDTRALRAVIKWRKQDRQEREEQQAILETYLHAIGELEFYD